MRKILKLVCKGARLLFKRILKNRVVNTNRPIPTVNGNNVLTDANIIMRGKGGLERIQDENDVGYIDSENCVLVTMAAQYDEKNETFLQIDERLFHHPAHSKLSQAILVLHEFVYYSARKVGHDNSRATRALVASIINNDPIDYKTLRDLYRKLKMPEHYRLGSNNLEYLYLKELVKVNEDFQSVFISVMSLKGIIDEELKFTNDVNKLKIKYGGSGNFDAMSLEGLSIGQSSTLKRIIKDSYYDGRYSVCNSVKEKYEKECEKTYKEIVLPRTQLLVK